MPKAKENHGIAKLFLALTIVMFCAGCLSQISTTTSMATPQSVFNVQALKDQVGLVFIPVETSDIVKAKVSKQEAIARSGESGAPIQEATAIFTALGYLSNPILEQNAANGENVDPALLAHPLVWIISYEGVEIPSTGPPGAKQSIAHEYNVVINATTGDYIMAFVYQSSLYFR
jgi:hypothetical protein